MRVLYCLVVTVNTEIREKVMNGEIQVAIDMTKELFPKVFETKPQLLFLAKCRRFIEMIGADDAMSGVYGVTMCDGIAENSALRDSFLFLCLVVVSRWLPGCCLPVVLK